jgi:DNA polymerase-3 subunit epsilon
MISFTKKNRPEFVRDYCEQTHRFLAGKKSLEEIKLVALDTEASGFEVGKDRLLSIAVIEVAHNQIQLDQCVEWLVYQSGMTANKATEIHGILPSDTLKGQPESDVLEELLPRLSGAIVIGHQILFDALMLNDALRRNFGIGFRNPTIDVGLMAMNELQPFRKTGYINQRPPNIEDLCTHLGLPITERHTAEGDAYMAAEIFLLLCGQVRQRRGRLTKWDLPIKKA